MAQTHVKSGPAPFRMVTGVKTVPATYLLQTVTEGSNTFNGVVDMTTTFLDNEGTVTVAAANFPSWDEVNVGPYQLVEGIHFQGVDDDTEATATALATAIDRLQGYSASADGAVVTIVGPTGPTRYTLSVLNKVAPGNFTPSGPYLTGGTPILYPPFEP